MGNTDQAVELPPLATGTLRIVALGGIGEVGRNMTLLETVDGAVVIDCGVMFPSNDVPGVDFILPDFRPLVDRPRDIRAILLTHGHEDHIGGVSYFLREVANVPVYGSGFTLALLRAKLAEAKVEATLLEVAEGDVVNVGPFVSRFLAVNHSVPDGLAISLRYHDLHLFHTGDFKMDQQPLDGRLTDVAGFAELGRQGIDVLMSDSTNADVAGYLPDEVDVAPNFLHIFEETSGLVMVACFASHVHRVQQVINCARAAGRKVALVGRSMERNMRIARDAGLLDMPEDLLVPAKKIGDIPRHDLVIACTGSQGEPMAILARLARDAHQVKVQEGDVVIFSARLIPGNETDVFRVINALSEKGVQVLHGGNADIHASGHAPAGELRQVINLTRPKYLIPVHGEWRHLRAHASIAATVGYARDRVIFAPNGTVVDLNADEARVVGSENVESVMVDTTSVGLMADKTLRDRRVMGSGGSLTVIATVDAGTGRLTTEPRLELRGMERGDDFFTHVARLIREVIDSGPLFPHADQERRISSTLHKWLRSEHRRAPLLAVVVVPVGSGE